MFVPTVSYIKDFKNKLKFIVMSIKYFEEIDSRKRVDVFHSLDHSGWMTLVRSVTLSMVPCSSDISARGWGSSPAIRLYIKYHLPKSYFGSTMVK